MGTYKSAFLDAGEIVCKSDVPTKTLPVSELGVVSEVVGEVIDDVAFPGFGIGNTGLLEGEAEREDCWCHVWFGMLEDASLVWLGDGNSSFWIFEGKSSWWKCLLVFWMFRNGASWESEIVGDARKRRGKGEGSLVLTGVQSRFLSQTNFKSCESKEQQHTLGKLCSYPGSYKHEHQVQDRTKLGTATAR